MSKIIQEFKQNNKRRRLTNQKQTYYYCSYFFTINDIKNGATFEFWMDSKPSNTFWKNY